MWKFRHGALDHQFVPEVEDDVIRVNAAPARGPVFVASGNPHKCGDGMQFKVC